jgi:tRNA threonylcarbamoyladenosine biosynthesis protein TsaB
MLLIGIETSGLKGTVALLRDGELLEERSLQQAGQRHAQAMVLEMQGLLRAAGLTPRDVEGVAVSRGPGSFTGLRVGLVCAKTFAYATGCRFVGVDTFLATAANCPGDVPHVWIVEDAQRGDLFAGHYRRADDGWWQLSSPIEIVSGEAWLAARSSAEVVTGRGLARQDVSLVAARCLAGDATVLPTATSVARLGEKLLAAQPTEAGPDFDFWNAVPFYIRPSAAEEQRDRRLAMP